MIKIIRGDLLEAEENIICHQVNCQGVMGSGVALQVKQKHPHVYASYKDGVEDFLLENPRSNLLGKIQLVNIGNKQYIGNLFGQLNYGRDNKVYTDTNALFSCFTQIRAIAEKKGCSVAMPYMIGCYRGGADWKLVEEMLMTAFDGYEVTLYKYHRG